jgi:hypothetical protein
MIGRAGEIHTLAKTADFNHRASGIRKTDAQNIARHAINRRPISQADFKTRTTAHPWLSVIGDWGISRNPANTWFLLSQQHFQPFVSSLISCISPFLRRGVSNFDGKSNCKTLAVLPVNYEQIALAVNN